MLVLGIETSCDDTAVALYDADRGLLCHLRYSQIKLHESFGGIVPELSSRDHASKLMPLLLELFKKTEKNWRDLTAIAYTAGPGLIGALLTGAALARALAYSLNIPCLGVHHMEGHLLAPMLEQNKPEFPFIALLVSGGHTLLVEVNAIGNYRILGQSVDDAAGEAFDKTARVIGLAYPGGPLLAKLAEQGIPNSYTFPRPMTQQPGLDFSFSGLKTHAVNTWDHSDKSEQAKANIAHAFQEAVVDTLIIKCRRALEQTGLNRLVIAGGVSANLMLRSRLKQVMDDVGGDVFYPALEFCTDNAAMIAYAGFMRLKQGECDDDNVQIRPRWPLEELV